MNTQNILAAAAGLAVGYFAFREKDSVAVGNTKEYPKLRSVEVTYSTGDVISTSMAAHLSDEDIYAYFKPGRIFNIGNGPNDKLAKVVDVNIIN